MCQYCSAGNYRGQFAGNVFLPTKTEAECSAGSSPAPSPSPPPSPSSSYCVDAAISDSPQIKLIGGLVECSDFAPYCSGYDWKNMRMLIKSDSQFLYRRRQHPLTQSTALIPPTFSLQSTAMCSGLPVSGQTMATRA